MMWCNYCNSWPEMPALRPLPAPPAASPASTWDALDAKKDWDAVLMVLPDENFDATEIYEAQRRSDVLQALAEPGSVARNERGALGVRKFKVIGKLR
jgi:hypothetical protein